MDMKNPLLWTVVLASAAATAQAEVDVTSVYIKNAAVDGAQDWEATCINSFNASCAESYMGHSSVNRGAYKLVQKVKLPAGSYTLTGYAFHRIDGASQAYLKAGDAKVLVGKRDGSAEGFAPANLPNSMAAARDRFAEGYYRNVLTFVLDEEKEIEIGFEGTHPASGDSWFIAGGVELVDLEKTSATSAVTNADFENTNGWTGLKRVPDTKNAITGNSGESYSPNAANNVFNTYQTVRLAEGKYAIWADMFNSINGAQGVEPTSGEAGMYVQLKSGLKKVLVPTSVEQNPPRNMARQYFIEFEVPKGGEEVTIGFKNFATMTARWFVFDNVNLIVESAEVFKAMSTELSIAINKANGITDDATLQELLVRASALWGELNSRRYVDYMAYVDNNMSTDYLPGKIQQLSKEIQAAVDNYNCYENALAAHTELVTKLGELRTACDAVDDALKANANEIYNSNKSIVDDFKSAVETSYQAGTAGTDYSATNLASKKQTIMEGLEEAIASVGTGNQNYLNYVTVNTEVVAAQTAYSNALTTLYTILSGEEWNAVYGNMYLAAAKELNTENTKIAKVKAAIDADKAGVTDELKTEHVATLQAAETKIGQIVANYTTLSEEQKAYNTAARQDIENSVQTYYDANLDAWYDKNADSFIKGCPFVLTTYATQLEAIRTQIAALWTLVADANKAYTLEDVTGDWCEGYAEKKTAIIEAIDALKLEVTAPVAEWQDYLDCKSAIEAKQTSFGTVKTRVNALVSTDGKYAVDGFYAGVEKEIDDALAALLTEALDYYNDSEKDAGTFKAGLTGKLNEIQTKIDGYESEANAALASYNAVVPVLKADQEKLATLKATIANRDVTIDGNAPSTEPTYGERYDALSAIISKQDSILTAALAQADKEHATTMKKLTLADAVATELDALTASYAVHEATWIGQQQDLAKETMLENADQLIEDTEELIPAADYDQATYGLKYEELNTRLAAIKADIVARKNEVNTARTLASAEAIAILPDLVAKLTKIKNDMEKLGQDAEDVKDAYIAETARYNAALARVAAQTVQIEGGTDANNKRVKAITAINTDTNRNQEFADSVALLNANKDEILAMIDDSYATETLEADLLDSTQGTEMVLGINSLLSKLDTRIQVVRNLAQASADNFKAYNDMNTYLITTKKVPANITAAFTNLDKVDGTVGSHNPGEQYFWTQLTTYQNTTLAGITQDITTYYNNRTAKAQQSAVNTRIDNLNNLVGTKADEGIVKLATDNQKSYDAQKDAKTELDKLFAAALAEITGSDVSSAHEAALERLSQIQKSIAECNTAIDADFALGKSDTNKAVHEGVLQDIEDEISALRAGWQDTYCAAVSADNLERKTTFNTTYTAVVQAYQKAVTLVSNLSKTSSAAGLTDEQAKIATSDGIYLFGDKIRAKKAEADAAYTAAQADIEQKVATLYDPNEEFTAALKKFQDSNEVGNEGFLALRDQYAAAVNANALSVYSTEYATASGKVDAAKNALATWNQTIVNKAFTEVEAILSDSQVATTAQDFATQLDGILAKFASIDAKIAAAQEAAAEGQWESELNEAETLAQSEAQAIAGFLPKNKYVDSYATLCEAIADAKEATGRVEEGTFYASITQLRNVLNPFTSTISVFTAPGDGKSHTAIYQNAYTEDKTYRANDNAYNDVLAKIANAQDALDAVIADVKTLCSQNSSVLVVELENKQDELDGYVTDAGRYHSAGASEANKAILVNACTGFVNGLTAFYTTVFTQENGAVAAEIELLKQDYSQAEAAILNDDDEENDAKLDGYRTIIASYEANNRTYLDEFVNGKKDKDGNYLSPTVKATKDETLERYQNLETLIGQLRAELTAIYNAELVANTTAEVQEAWDALNEKYQAVVDELATCHQQVVDEYSEEADEFKSTLEELQLAINAKVSDKSILVYAGVLKQNIKEEDDFYDGLLDDVKNAETPYDVHDLKYEELSGELEDLRTRLESVNEVAEGYEYQYEYRSMTREDLYDEIDALITEAEDALEGHDINDPYTRLTGSSTNINVDEIESRTDAMEKKCAYYNATKSLRAVSVPSLDANLQYAPADRNKLLSSIDEIRNALTNAGSFSDEYNLNGSYDCDIDGNPLQNAVVMEYIEAYPVVMNKLEQIKSDIEALQTDIDAAGYKLGDVNRDGAVTVTDYTLVRNMVIGVTEYDKESALFYAADIDGNGEVNIGDVTKVANIIMYGDANYVGVAPDFAQMAALNAQADVLGFAVEGSGAQRSLAISLDNARDYVGLQLDVKLPEGMTLVSAVAGDRAYSHDVLSNETEGVQRILVSNLNGDQLGHNGVVVYLNVNVEGYRSGNIEVSNVLAADADARTYSINGLLISEPTSMTMTTTEKVVSKIYSVGGQMLNGLKKGINIIVNSDGSVEKVNKRD